MKKALSIFALCLLLITGCAKQSVSGASMASTVTSEATSSSAASTPVLKEGDYDYIVQDGSVTIVKYNGTSENIVIPDTIDGLPVKAIGDSAFRNNSTLKSVVISDSVISIGTSAFESCSALKTVTMGKSVEVISDFSFENTSIEEIKIESDLKEVGRWAFYDCRNLK